MNRVLLSTLAAMTLSAVATRASATTCSGDSVTFPSFTPEVQWCADNSGTSVLWGPLGLAQFSLPNVYAPSGTGVLAYQESGGSALVSNPFYTIINGKAPTTKIVPAYYSSTGKGVLLFGASDDYLYNIDALTGACNWRTYLGRGQGVGTITDTGCVTSDYPNSCGDTVLAEPALVYNTTESSAVVYIATSDSSSSCSGTANRIYAIDVATGAPVWTPYNYSGGTTIADVNYAVGPDVVQEPDCASNRNQLVAIDTSGVVTLLNASTGALLGQTSGLLGGSFQPAGLPELAYASNVCGAMFVAAKNGSSAEIQQLSLGASAGSVSSSTFSGFTVPTGLSSPITMSVGHERSASSDSVSLVFNANGTTHVVTPSINCTYAPTYGATGLPFILSSSAVEIYTATKEGSVVQLPLGAMPASGSCPDYTERFVSATNSTTLTDPGADFTSGGSALLLTGDPNGRVSELSSPFNATNSLIVNVTNLTASGTISWTGTASGSLPVSGTGLYVIEQTPGTYTVTMTSGALTCKFGSATSDTATLATGQDTVITASCSASTLYTLSVVLSGPITGGNSSPPSVTFEDLDNTSDILTETTAGTYTFPYQIASGASYQMKVTSEPGDGGAGGAQCAFGTCSGSACTMSSNETVNLVCSCSGTDSQCGSSCVNLQGDDNNCGQCGFVCPVGTCTKGLCVFNNSKTTGTALLAEDSTYLYWMNLNNQNTRRMTKVGGAVQQILEGAGSYSATDDDGGGGGTFTTTSQSIAVDANNFYFMTQISNGSTVEGGIIGYYPLSDIPADTAADSFSCLYDPYSGVTPGAIATDSTYMYWTTGVNVMQFPIADFTGRVKAGSTPNRCSGLTPSAQLKNILTLSGSSAMNLNVSSPEGVPGKSPMAVAAGSTSAVETMTTPGGSTPVAFTGANNAAGATRIISDGTNFWWTTSAGNVVYAPVGGGAATILNSNAISVPYSIASDGTNAYWGTTNGIVYKMAIGDSAPTQLAQLASADRGTIYGVVVDSTYVWFTDTIGNNIMVTAK